MKTRRALRWQASRVIRRQALGFLVLAPVLIVGCTLGPPATRDVTVRGRTPAGEAVRVRPIELSEAVGELLYATLDTSDENDTVKPRAPRYAVRMFPGQLMVVEFGWSNDRDDALLFPWVYDPAAGEPLAFAHDGPALRVNGAIVTLDLIRGDAAAWLERNRDVPLDAVGVVLLSGRWEIDRAVLATLEGSGCVVGVAAYDGSLPTGLPEAVLACRPTGLVVEDERSARALVARAGRLRHLICPAVVWPRPPRPEGLWTLMRLGADATAAPLDWLGEYEQLRVLSLGEADDDTSSRPGSYDAIGRLAHLRSLVVPCPVDDAALEVFAGLGGLEILALWNAGDVHDLAPLAGLPRLRRVALLNLPEDVSHLAVLEDLNDLEAVLFTSDTVEANQAQIDRLREARPDVIIQGFCLGSRWMVAVVAGGVLGGVALRARRHRVTACAGR